MADTCADDTLCPSQLDRDGRKPPLETKSIEAVKCFLQEFYGRDHRQKMTFRMKGVWYW